SLPADLWAAVQWLVLNEIEAEQLAGRAIASVDDAVAVAQALQHPDQHVVVTLGRAGAVLVGGGEVVHAPAPQVAVVDTTAAGDAFVGVLAAGLQRGLSPTQAVRQAVVAGSLACTKAGAIPSLPTADEVRREMGNGSAHRDGV
ncbi:MAG: PfkB family carbohydrate kinase, partial [Gaiellaceae bacterium]